jgi:nucleoside triphosphate diphosphatase
MPHTNAPQQFQRLVDIVAQLRAPEGCPWDREQTIESLCHFVLEEAYEVVDAIERGDLDALREEIGDHIFEGVFLAQIAAERGLFDVGDSLHAVADKLIRRHPHVFQTDGQVHDAESKERAPSANAALERWNTLKAEERAQAGRSHTVLGGIPKGLPALLRAFKIGKRAAEVGFDWKHSESVIEKIEEEVAELREALEGPAPNPVRVEEEMGDLLLAVANLSRKLDIDPEAALRKANDKFTRRFQGMEQAIGASGRSMRDMNIEELEREWQAAKSGLTG